jgi:hypothetical protein
MKGDFSTIKNSLFVLIVCSIFFIGLPNNVNSQCNTNTTICQAGIAGPFNFVSAQAGISPTCGINFPQNSAGFILLHITQGGPLHLLINGNATTGFIDVAIYNIPDGIDPCVAVTSNANQIACHFAGPASGCNQFGNSFPCTATNPAPNVNAGDVVMIVIDNWSNASSSFTLQLGTGPGLAQTGPPDASILEPEVCHEPYQLKAVINGGTWTGPGTSAGGMFDPVAAGAGLHMITYSIGTGVCNDRDTIYIDLTCDCVLRPGEFVSLSPITQCSDDPYEWATDLQLNGVANHDTQYFVITDANDVIIEYIAADYGGSLNAGSYCVYSIALNTGYDTILPVPDGIITLADLISAITAETGICVSISETCKPVNIYPSAQILISQDTFSACPGSSVQVIVGVDEPLDESICGQVISCDNPEVLQPIGPTGAPGFTQAYSNSVRARMQVIYTQAELIGLGVEPGQVIASIGFRTLALSSTGFDGYEDYTIKVGCTNLSSLEGGYIGDLTTVFSEDIVLAADSWNVHVFDSPYYWDGTSNLVVEVCYTNPSQPKNAAVWAWQEEEIKCALPHQILAQPPDVY